MRTTSALTALMIAGRFDLMQEIPLVSDELAVPAHYCIRRDDRARFKQRPTINGLRLAPQQRSLGVTESFPSPFSPSLSLEFSARRYSMTISSGDSSSLRRSSAET